MPKSGKLVILKMGIKGSIAWYLMTEKINLVVFKALLHSVTGYIVENEGVENTYEVLKELGRKGGKWIIMHYLEKTKPVAETVKDYWKAANLGIKIFLGKEFDEIFYDVREGGRKVLLVLRIKNNPICKDMISPDPRIRFSATLAGTLEWILTELRKDVFGAQSVRVDETKCIAVGDEYCEFTIEWTFSEERAESILNLFKKEGIHKVK